MRRHLLSFIALALVACAADSTPPYSNSEPLAAQRREPGEAGVRSASAAVVYGVDDRLDWYAVEDEALRSLTEQAIVALIRPGNLDGSDAADVRIDSRILGPSRNLCEDERFYDQPRAANCSGTLIDEDLVLTAGHCVDDLEDCQNYRFVFDYLYEAEGVLRTIDAEEDVYTCAELVVRELADGIDHAVVRLDRPVHGSHVPARVRESVAPMEEGDEVTVIGFGSGIPAKIDTGGRVLDPRSNRLDYFNATTDTFGGNSGSGVFDGETDEVVGILVRGARDYVDDDEADCTRVNTLPSVPDEEADDSDGEDIVYASRAIEALCADDVDTPLCGGPGGWCRLCELDEDCLEGWTCVDAGDATGASWCAPECELDEDCRSDHVCGESGYCEPEVVQRCFEGDVWLHNACGRRIAVAEDCGREQVCTDDGCIAAGVGNACSNPEILDGPGVVTGEIGPGYVDTYGGSCGGDGPDRVFRFRLDEPTRVRATVSGFDTVLHLRGECENADTEAECNDDANPPGGRGSRIEVELDAGSYYLFVDTYGNEPGGFELEVEYLPLCPCSIGDARCAGDSVERCLAAGGSCAEWTAEPCGSGETCVEAACVPADPYDSCATARTIEPSDAEYTGDLSGNYGDHGTGECGGVGADTVYAFTLGEATTFRASAEGGDPVLHLRERCDDADTEIACGDAAADDGVASVEAILPDGTFHLFVDSHDAERAGPYTLSVRFDPACVDECDTPGEFVCLGPTTFRTCGQTDADSCLDQSPEGQCEAGSRCSDESGACVPNDPPDAGLDAADAVDATDAVAEPGTDVEDAVVRRSRSRSRGCVVAGREPVRGALPSVLVPLAALLALRPRRRR